MAFQHGFGALAAILVTVLLALLAAAVVRLSGGSQMSFAQDIASARALRAANAGAEWGLDRAFRGAWKTGCSNATQTLDLRADTDFIVTVTCNATTFNEGDDGTGSAQALMVYTISAVACNGSAATCPDNASAARATYVERERLVQATNR